MKHYFGLTNHPVNLAKIAIGDGTIGNGVVFEVVPLVWHKPDIAPFSMILTLDPDDCARDLSPINCIWHRSLQMVPRTVGILHYLYTPILNTPRNHLCGYDLNLTYPQNGKFPTLKFQPGAGTPRIFKRQESLLTQVWDRYQISKKRGAEIRREWKRDLSLRANGTIDPYYGCSLLREVLDYAVNYTYPWNEFPDGSSLDVSIVFRCRDPSYGRMCLVLQHPFCFGTTSFCRCLRLLEWYVHQCNIFIHY